MGARGAASTRMAAMQATMGFGRIKPAQGLAALATVVRDRSLSVLGVLPIVWSRFLGGGKTTPAFLSAFAPKVHQIGVLSEDSGG